MSTPNLYREHSHDRLSHEILTHWQNYHPKMLVQFQQENRLEIEVEKTAQQMNDLMVELITVKKMSYPAAWEIAVDTYLLPEEEELS